MKFYRLESFEWVPGIYRTPFYNYFYWLFFAIEYRAPNRKYKIIKLKKRKPPRNINEI